MLSFDKRCQTTRFTQESRNQFSRKTFQPFLDRQDSIGDTFQKQIKRRRFNDVDQEEFQDTKRSDREKHRKKIVRKENTETNKNRSSSQSNGVLNSEKSPPTSKKKKLSCLQTKLLKKLNSGRFRYLNEQLYTTQGNDMLNIMKESPEIFYEYHKGYREQVQTWKRNPTDLIISWLIRKIPKTSKIADLGCGEAHVAKALPDHTILSFDLVSFDPKIVTVANISDLPLKNNSIDVCLFCLSLMGTDWTSFLTEAFRVLKKGGIIKIAEVQSRFVDVNKFVSGIVSLGFKLLSKEDIDSYFFMFEFIKIKKPLPHIPSLSSDLLTSCRYKKR